jgi:Methyltransferase domain
MSSSNENKSRFISEVEKNILSGKSFKITFSKQRHQNKEVINVYLKPVTIKQELHYTLTYRYKTRDEVKNYNPQQVMGVVGHLLGNMFFNAVMFYDDVELTLLQNKKEKATLISKKLAHEINIETTHDHEKERWISSDKIWLQELGLAGKDGRILDKSQDKYRQINKYIEIVDHLIRDFPIDKMITIADMGSGKGYLTFALYDHLVNTKKMRCRMTGYELREDIVALCYTVAMKCGFVGLTFQKKSIDEANVTDTDMVIALHACDIATDMAIAKGIQAQARYIVVSPCCHKQIRSVMKHNNALSPILKNGILEERQAEIITDGIRALLMEANGYKAQVFEFISSEHTGKNLMITGVKSAPDDTALKKVDELKKLFVIEYHYLEKLLAK